MLDEAIEYLKQLQLKVQTLTMRNRFDLPPVYAQEQGMQRGMGIGIGIGIGMGMGKGYEGIGMGYNEGYKFPNTSEGFSARWEVGIMSNHIGMLSSTNMVKSDPGFCSELENVKQYEFANHSTSIKVAGCLEHLKEIPCMVHA
ncbi:putative basic helix-loop-helix (bHLH) transcription factor ALC-like, plant [Helianthus annuus]|nr:putative basic helix-loop-helix (bHLH) transcription factor ALC-like, plant [Helianthus annuus]